MKRLFRFRYPKLITLLTLSIIAIYLFKYSAVGTWAENLNELNYIGAFIAGMMFSFGFSTPFAIGFFLTMRPDNIILTAMIGGVGALISDLLIFKLIKVSFMDEFERLEKTEPLLAIKRAFSTKHLIKIKIYLLYIFAGIVIASPLPDGLGVSMLAGLTAIKTRTLAVISFIMNFAGILIILLISQA